MLRGLFVDTEQKRAEAVGAFGGVGVAGDDELLLEAAFGFEPVGAAAGAVGSVALGDDAFGLELAGLGEDGGAAAVDVIAEAECAVVAVGEDGGEEFFARAELEVAGVVAVVVEEVEDEVGERVALAFVERCLQRGEGGDAAVVEDDDFAVEGEFVGGEGGDGVGDGAHAVRPVEAFAGEELDAGAGFAGLDAVAVELDLVKPGGAVGRSVGLYGELWRDEGGLGFGGEVGCGGFGCGLCGAAGADVELLADGRALRGGWRAVAVVAVPGAACAGGVFGVPDVVALAGDLVHGAAGDGGVGFGVGDGGRGFGALEVVVFFDEEPVGLVRGAPARAGGFARGAMRMSVHLPCSLVPSRTNLSEPSCEGLRDVFVAGLRVPGALVPDHDGAAAVLAFGDDAFEAAVLHGVVFDLHGEAAVAGVVAGALGDGPGFEDAVPAEAEVVVQMRGGVLLDDEGEAFGA